MNIVSYSKARADGLKHYFNGSECVNGHLSLRLVCNRQCIECDKQRKLLVNKFQYQKHKEKRLQKAAEYRAKNKLKLAINSASYISARRKLDPMYAMKDRLSVRIREAFQAKGIKKNTKTIDMLGCDIVEFKAHIEKQFLFGMSWENKDQWHVDHIVPCASAKNEEELKALFHYTNLRPIWAKDNLSKSNKTIYLI
jgi:hypothetical protein